jgi:hypothetical protein
MREKLNSNPLAQVLLIGVLLIGAGFFVLSSLGGGGGGSSTTSTTSATVTTPAGSASVEATVTTPSTTALSDAASAPTSVSGAAAVPAPPLPRPVTAAFAANRTVVLLIVKKGGIDDRMVAAAVHGLSSLSGVVAFVVPADQIARYAAITQGVKVDRVPALIVVRPKRFDHGIPTASLSYGFQSGESVVQAVRDATYKGRTLSYHP